MNPDPTQVEIGSLRWPVIVATREEYPDPSSAGILDKIDQIKPVRADIQPIGALTFYGAAQVDTPVTHRITMRWLDYLSTNSVIFRQTRLADGTPRTERFRVRRVMEVDGRKRFIRVDAELEASF